MALILEAIRDRFVRQKIIGPYIVDFYCLKLKWIIEIDGEQHYLDKNAEYERYRDNYFLTKGYKLLRFYNSDVNRNLKNTEITIYYSCINRAKELEKDIPVILKGRG